MTPLRRRPDASASRALWAVGLLVVSGILAGCTMPVEEDANGQALEPFSRDVRGLTPPARSHPMTMALSPDGAKAYVALAGTIARPDDRIAVVDLEDGTLVSHLDVGVRPLALATDPVHPHLLWVAHPYSPSLTVVNMTSDRVEAVVSAPYYLEGLAFAPDGGRLLAADRDLDRLLVWRVTRDDGLALELERSIPTGPNPQHVALLSATDDTTQRPGQYVVATARHGSSLTLARLDDGANRTIDLGGPPLSLATRDGIVVVGTVLGDGDPDTPDLPGATVDPNTTRGEAGTADLENALVLLDLRDAAGLVGTHGPIARVAYVSDTAHPDRAAGTHRILAGAVPQHLVFEDRVLDAGDVPPERGGDATLWVTYGATDQVQALRWHGPTTGVALDAADAPRNLEARSGFAGSRLSALDAGRPQTPGHLTDTRHAVYETPAGPRQSLVHDRYLFTLSELTETLHVLDRDDCPGPSAPAAPCTSTSVALVEDLQPYPANAFEEGERLFHSALAAADQDRSCASCHVGGLSSHRTFALPHRNGTAVAVPRLDDMTDQAPWLLDGSVRVPGDYLRAAGGDLLAADPSDPSNLAPGANESGRNGTTAGTYAIMERAGPVVANVTDPARWLDLIWGYLMGEPRLLPPPPGRSDPGDPGADLAEGMRVFTRAGSDCARCHADGDQARLLPEAASSEVPRPGNVSRVKAPALDGLWDRTGTGWLYDGRAPTLASALLPDGHRCLDGTPGYGAWHGNLEDRTCEAVDDLSATLLVLQTRR